MDDRGHRNETTGPAAGRPLAGRLRPGPPPLAGSGAGSGPDGYAVSIQYLRGIAAIGVSFFHIGLVFKASFEIGAAGVDLFFVISGFVMWLVTEKRELHPKSFVLHRLIRIVPLYWLATLALAAGASLKPNLFPLDHPSLGHVLYSLFFVPHPSTPYGVGPLLIQGWTLEYEMLFYAVFALALFAPRGRQALVILALISGLFVLGLAPAFGDPGALVRVIRDAYTSPILLEFLLGVVVGWAWVERKLPGPRGGAGLLALGAALFAASARFHGIEDSLSVRTVVWGVPAFCVVAGAVALERAGKVPTIRPLALLGDASYSIYLTHGFAALAVALVVPAALRPVGAHPALYVPTVFVAVAAGLACYWLVERPLTRTVRRLATPSRAVA